MPYKLNAREAIFGFVSWLSCRKDKVELGGAYDCAGLPDLIETFANVNELDEVSDGWHDNLVHPDGDEVACNDSDEGFDIASPYKL